MTSKEKRHGVPCEPLFQSDGSARTVTPCSEPSFGFRRSDGAWDSFVRGQPRKLWLISERFPRLIEEGDVYVNTKWVSERRNLQQ